MTSDLLKLCFSLFSSSFPHNFHPLSTIHYQFLILNFPLGALRVSWSIKRQGRAHTWRIFNCIFPPPSHIIHQTSYILHLLTLIYYLLTIDSKSSPSLPLPSRIFHLPSSIFHRSSAGTSVNPRGINRNIGPQPTTHPTTIIHHVPLSDFESILYDFEFAERPSKEKGPKIWRFRRNSLSLRRN